MNRLTVESLLSWYKFDRIKLSSFFRSVKLFTTVLVNLSNLFYIIVLHILEVEIRLKGIEEECD